jgi:hypothetical protein
MSLPTFARIVSGFAVMGALVGCRTSPGGDVDEPVTSNTVTLSSRSALFVVGSTTLNAGDDAVSQRLQALGLTVVVKTDTAATSADATGKTIVVISSTVTSSNVGTKFKSVAVPVLLWESALLDDMGMTGSSGLGIASGQTRARVVAPSSDPMAAGLSGSQTVVAGSSVFSWGVPGPQAMIVAQLDADAGKAALFRYEKGSSMVGMTAPERRVALFLENTTASVLNASGRALVDAAIQWAAYDTGVCAPGSTRVCGGGGTQTCSASGTWGTCTGGTACTPGTTQACSGGGTQTCSASGTWGTCTGGTACTPGTMQCGVGGLQICAADGTWITPISCP